MLDLPVGSCCTSAANSRVSSCRDLGVLVDDVRVLLRASRPPARSTFASSTALPRRTTTVTPPAAGRGGCGGAAVQRHLALIRVGAGESLPEMSRLRRRGAHDDRVRASLRSRACESSRPSMEGGVSVRPKLEPPEAHSDGRERLVLDARQPCPEARRGENELVGDSGVVTGRVVALSGEARGTCTFSRCGTSPGLSFGGRVVARAGAPRQKGRKGCPKRGRSCQSEVGQAVAKPAREVPGPASRGRRASDPDVGVGDGQVGEAREHRVDLGGHELLHLFRRTADVALAVQQRVEVAAQRREERISSRGARACRPGAPP